MIYAHDLKDWVHDILYLMQFVCVVGLEESRDRSIRPTNRPKVAKSLGPHLDSHLHEHKVSKYFAGIAAMVINAGGRCTKFVDHHHVDYCRSARLTSHHDENIPTSVFGKR